MNSVRTITGLELEQDIQCDTIEITSTLSFDSENILSTSGQNLVVVLKNIPTSDPNVVGQLWNDSGTLKISLG